MNTVVTLDKAGRVVIPKTVRDELHLGPGDPLDLGCEGESVTLRPMRSSSPLRRDRGVWVFQTGRTLPAAVADEVLRESRSRRDRSNRGDAR
jgi:AbrB family looped-hinge helix DNA binding protein